MILGVLVFAACANASPPPATEPAAAPPMTSSPPGATVRETIEETTVGDLGGVSVPMGSMLLEDEYTLGDGTKARGPVGALALEGGAVWVGKGSVVDVGGARWEVVDVKKSAGEPGSVTLERKER